jgi:hypothetical protein
LQYEVSRCSPENDGAVVGHHEVQVTASKSILAVDFEGMTGKEMLISFTVIGTDGIAPSTKSGKAKNLPFGCEGCVRFRGIADKNYSF